MKPSNHIKGTQLPFLQSAPPLFLLGFILVLCEQAVQAAATAPTAAQAWLALVDKGDYAKSWEAGGDLFRKQVTKDEWVASLKSVRQPLGGLISRKASSAKETESLPGMPA